MLGGYTGTKELPEKIETLRALAEETGAPVMCFFGVGNHGGGPTIEGLRTIDACRAADSGESTLYSSPDRYFDALRPMAGALPVHGGEMQHHASGCYSAFSAGKQKNRRSENALLQAEKFSALSRSLTGHAMNAQAMARGWQNVMFNQFHDLMCGCSIRSGLEDAILGYDEALMIAAREENAALQKISWRVDTMLGRKERVRSKQDGVLWGRDDLGTPVVLFNPHPFPVEGVAAVRGALGCAKDAQGRSLLTQNVRAERTNGADHIDTIVQAALPALGYRLVMLYHNDPEPTENTTFATQTSVGNDRICAEFDPESGAMVSLRLDGREYLRAPARPLLADVSHCDTWAHGVFTFDRIVGELGGAEFRVLENGPVRSALRVVTRRGNTVLTQIFRAYRGSDQLEVEATLDLQEKHVMVKLEYPLALQDAREFSEVPLGAIERSCTGMEEPCARWFALSGQEAGLAIINDGKHSYSCAQVALRFTVANSSMYADHYGQAHRDDTADHLDVGEQRFRFVIAPFAGDWADAGLNRRADRLNQTVVAIQETYHEGPLSPEYEGFSIDAENVSLECLKPAEDGGGMIVRLRECSGRPTSVQISAPLLKRAWTAQLGALKQQTWFVPDDPAKEPTIVSSIEE
ncbi:MAG: glycoside hydrolase family 38 C-terminal domain-containing protein [Eubacteriales bacterium]|nr:glycoside hydrolase family 38 C-terminal domain-containing protein [Eubacteriales bacterium]